MRVGRSKPQSDRGWKQFSIQSFTSNLFEWQIYEGVASIQYNSITPLTGDELTEKGSGYC